MMPPALAINPLQFVPNSYERTIPETTPIPNDSAKTVVQNRRSGQ
jgi:hypothetical protein